MAETKRFYQPVAVNDKLTVSGGFALSGTMIGAIYEFWDVATAVWACRIVSDAGGTEATPFS